MMHKLKFLVPAVVLAFSGFANAAIMPSGILTDTAVSTVTDDYGWEFLYRGGYGSYGSIASVFGSLNANDWVMLGGINNSTNKFEVAAAAQWGQISTHTNLNQTNAFNGALWYYNGNSMGFAELNGSINQTTADTACSVWSATGCAVAGDFSKRLSWHTNYVPQINFYGQDSAISPTYFGNGWRAGANVSLNNSFNFDMAVLVLKATDNPTVAAPSALALFGLGLLGLGLQRRKKAKNSV